MDPVLLSRVQFAFLIAFHFLLPAFTIGLASYIAVLEGLFLWTRRPAYLRLSAFWVRIFAVSFGMGVVSGIVMPFQLGTNWSRYSELTAAVVGPLMGYEALMAFFLEAAFLGVLLFGRKLVPSWVHFASTIIVAVGTLFSAFWILAANSWMQTPAGFAIVDDASCRPTGSRRSSTRRSRIAWRTPWWRCISCTSCPTKLTLWDAATAPEGQAFLLIGTMFLIPVIFMYTGWSYWSSGAKCAQARDTVEATWYCFSPLMTQRAQPVGRPSKARLYPGFAAS